MPARKPQKPVRAPKASEVTHTDLAERRTGDNKLHGNDQEDVRNQRHAVADTRQETDDPVESLEKLDKDVRARRDLGKRKS